MVAPSFVLGIVIDTQTIIGRETNIYNHILSRMFVNF